MKYRKFADLNWRVSEIGLSCWGIGGNWVDVTNTDAREVLKKSLNKGINFLIQLMYMEMEEVKNLLEN